jgi:PKD repeat protein
MRTTRIVHAAVAVGLVALALALPALASANLYCVNEPACVKAGGTSEGSEGIGLQKALTSAEGHAGSTVEIGAGTYSRAKGFEYSGVPVTIRGAGAGSTILTTPLENGDTVLVFHSEGSTLSGLSVAVTAGEGQQGISLDGGRIEGVSISGGAGGDIPTGLSISRGSFSDGSIEMSEAQTSLGVNASGGELLDSTISGGYGVDASLAVAIRGCRISSRTFGIDAVYTKPLTVEDTLVYLRGSPPAAISLSANSGGDTQATLRGLTILDANGTEAGIEVEAREGASTTLALEDSVIDNFAHPILEAAEGHGSGIATTTDYSSYEASADKREIREETEPGGTLPLPVSDESPAASTPDFVHPVFGAGGFGEGNWRLLATSPLIGAGKPGPLAPGELATDLAGNPRVVDGARDVGAYEYQRPAPVVSATGAPLTVEAGVPVSFSGSASVIEPGDAIAGYRWTFDDGASVPAGATATHAFAAAGTHTATLTATDVVGVKGTAVVSVVVTAAPPLLPACKCRRPIASLTIAPGTFRAARKGASIAGAPVGARVGFKLSAAGHVTFTVKRVLAGVAHGRSCVSPAHGSTHGKRCTRDVLVHGSFAHAGVAGANSLRFSGRVHGHALAPGSYLLIATYSGGAGRASASAPFRIVG